MANPSHYAAGVIKPDAHRDVISEVIILELQEGGLDIIFRKDIVFSKEQAEQIYSEHEKSQHFDASVKSILGTEKSKFATLFIVKSKDGKALERLQQIKGQSDQGGVRLKYRRFSKEELKKFGLEGNELLNELAKNRLHVPDSDERCKELMNMSLNESEKNELKEREPELYEELNEQKKEIKKELMIRENKLR